MEFLWVFGWIVSKSRRLPTTDSWDDCIFYLHDWCRLLFKRESPPGHHFSIVRVQLIIQKEGHLLIEMAVPPDFQGQTSNLELYWDLGLKVFLKVSVLLVNYIKVNGPWNPGCNRDHQDDITCLPWNADRGEFHHPFFIELPTKNQPKPPIEPRKKPGGPYFPWNTLPETNIAPTTGWVGILLSYWGGLVSGAFPVSFREGTGCLIGIPYFMVYETIPMKPFCRILILAYDPYIGLWNNPPFNCVVYI